MREWNELEKPKALPGYSGGRLPGRNTKEKGREEGEPDDGRKERKIRNEITQEVVASIKEEASAISRLHKEQSDNIFSKIETARKSKTRKRRKEDQMAVQWDEEQQLEEILERRRMEGNSLQLEVTQKLPELVVHERMTRMVYSRNKKTK